MVGDYGVLVPDGDVTALARAIQAVAKVDRSLCRERALARRNWVISRMAEERFITAYEAAEARGTDLDVSLRSRGVQTRDAEYFLEQVRRELLAQ